MRPGTFAWSREGRRVAQMPCGWPQRDISAAIGRSPVVDLARLAGLVVRHPNMAPPARHRPAKTGLTSRLRCANFGAGSHAVRLCGDIGVQGQDRRTSATEQSRRPSGGVRHQAGVGRRAAIRPRRDQHDRWRIMTDRRSAQGSPAPFSFSFTVYCPSNVHAGSGALDLTRKRTEVQLLPHPLTPLSRALCRSTRPAHGGDRRP